MELSTLDYHYLLREWHLMVGGRIQKIYMKDRTLVLQVYSRANYTWLFSDGKSFTTKAKLEYPSQPTGFTMFLRKRFQGSRITHVQLLGFDRVLAITIQTKDGPQQLIVELFDKVNYIVCKEGKIVSSFETHTYSIGRTIRGGVEYVAPTSKPAPWDADLKVLVGKEAARTTATELSLGGKYAEELCARAKIDRKHTITHEDLPALAHAIAALREHALAPRHNHAEALPFEFLTKQGEWKQEHTFNEAIDAIESLAFERAEATEKASEFKARQTKQEKIVAAQKKQLETLNTTIAENQRKGELVYEHYTELQTLMAQLKQDWAKLSLAQIKEKYKDHPRIKSIEKDGTIEVEL
jgi:predicted ribosome quality control (RQC) complex YloA/Tae2 family protein